VTSVTCAVTCGPPLCSNGGARSEYRPNECAYATPSRLRILDGGGSLSALRPAMTMQCSLGAAVLRVIGAVRVGAAAQIGRAAGVAIVLAIVVFVATHASAQPIVRVRAESRIELRTERRDGRVVVVGVLRDDLGEALADREVMLHARSADAVYRERRTVRTDTEGKLNAEFALPLGAYRLGATFVGDPDHERVEVERSLDLDRADVRLRVTVPEHGRLRLDVAEHLVDVVAVSDAGGGGLHVELSDELGRSLGTGTSDAAGRVRFVVRSEQLGPPAAGRIVARGAADALRADAQTEVPVVRVSPTRLGLSIAATHVQLGEPIRARGRLVDHAGRALPREAVGLFDRSEHLATVLTGEDGAFDVRVEATREGALQLEARYDSDAPWRDSSASARVRVDVAGASGGPLGWLLGTVGVTALVLIVLGSRGRRRAALARPPAPAVRNAGIEAGARRGRADRVDVGGNVIDLRDDEPVSGALVTLHAGGADAAIAESTCDAAGAFAIAELAPGAYELRVACAGYASVTHALVVPHRGEWSAVRVRLDSLRDRALDAVAPIAAEILPQRAWGTATPREVLERARAKGPPPSGLPDLVARAERAAYAAAPPTSADLEATERARDEVLGALKDTAAKTDARR